MLQHRRQKQLFDVLSMLFWKHISLHLFSYPSRIEQDYLQEKYIWDKLLRDKQKLELSEKNQFCKKPKNLVEKIWYAVAAELFI